MLAEVLCAGGGSRSLINTGLGAKTAFPNGIRGGVYQNAGVLTSFYSFFFSFLSFLVSSSSSPPGLMVCLARRGAELDLKQSTRPGQGSRDLMLFDFYGVKTR